MYNLKRFEDAQDGPIGYETALKEMRNGHKVSHWIWYVFPQIKGLGSSYDSKYYGIDSLYEARQYMEFGELGHRLREITKEVIRHSDNGIYFIMGSDIDTLKFRSCMTLFDVVSPGECFEDALDTFFDGERDERTLSIIQTERDHFYSDSAFQRYHLGVNSDKGFFEGSSYDATELPHEKKLPTLVDLFLKGERIRDMIHHYLYHRDFMPYRLSDVESTLTHYCRVLLWDVLPRVDDQSLNKIVPQFKGWEERIDDVESAAETLDRILGVMKNDAPSLLENYAKDSLLKGDSD